MFGIKVPYFSLDKTFNSGQSLTWKMVDENKYIIKHKEHIITAEMKKDNMLWLGCSEEEFFSIWYDYFTIDTDYQMIHRKLSKSELYKDVCNQSKGVRIIKQDPMELLTTLLFKQKYGNRYLIKKDLFARNYGTTKKATINGSRIEWHTFPSIEQIANIPGNPQIQFEDTGKLLDPLRNIAKDLVDGNYEIEDIIYATEELRQFGITYIPMNADIELHQHQVIASFNNRPYMNTLDIEAKQWLDENGIEDEDELAWFLEEDDVLEYSNVAHHYVINYQRSF